MNQVTSTLLKAEKTVVVDYPATEVKAAINKVFTIMKSKYAPMKNGVNDIMGTYQFSMQNNLNPAIGDMALESISDNKTKISINVTASYGSVSSNSILASLLNDYLSILTKVLIGESIEQEAADAESSGCIWGIITAIIGFITLLLIFI